MMNFLKNKRNIIILLSVTLSLGWTVLAFAADPGSEKDPLISLSYFENKIEELKTDITNTLSKELTDKFDELKTSFEKTVNEIKDKGVSAPSTFEVINVNENESIICDAGTEIIVRSGKFTAIGSISGGISDVTSGRDLVTDEEIENNHLLIVPKSDGRGITAKVAGAVMIKGDFTRDNGI